MGHWAKGEWVTCGACGRDVYNSASGWRTHLEFCPAYRRDPHPGSC